LYLVDVFSSATGTASHRHDHRRGRLRNLHARHVVSDRDIGQRMGRDGPRCAAARACPADRNRRPADAELQLPQRFLGCVHHIFLPAASPTRASVQWWQLTTAGDIQQRGRIDDPSGATFYAYPSIAVNANSDVLIGYSRFSASQYAGANYSFRQSCNAANTLQSDAVAEGGEGPTTDRRDFAKESLGDYSSTVVDPRTTSICGRYKNTRQRRGTGASNGDGRWGPGGAGCSTIGSTGDVGIAMTASPDPVNAGSNVTYTMTVTNSGPNAGDRSVGHRRASERRRLCLGHD